MTFEGAAPQSSDLIRIDATVTDGDVTGHIGHLTDAVLSGAYRHAVEICQNALSNPRVGIERIHHALLLPVIRNVGVAWANDTAEFTQTSMAFTLLHRLIDRITALQAGHWSHDQVLAAHMPKALVAVAPGDTHSFGATILTQELRLNGWSVTCRDHRHCDAVLSDLAECNFAALAVSVSCDESLAGLADFVTACRMAARDPRLVVVIGGAAIQAPYDQYTFLGADKVGLAIEDVAAYLSTYQNIRSSDTWN